MAFATCLSSGDLSSDTQVATGRNMLHGAVVTAATSSEAAVHIYDGTDNTGKLLLSVRVDGNANRTNQVTLERPVRCTEGLFAEVTGSPENIVVHYG